MLPRFFNDQQPENQDQVQVNFAAFVAKGQSIAKAKGIDWDGNVWQVGQDQGDLLKANKGLHFRSIGSGKQMRDGVPFAEPFNSFAKACISILLEGRQYSSGSLDNFMRPLRSIYSVEPDPRRFADSTFQAALDLFFTREILAKRSRASIASRMETIADIVDSYHLSVEPISWKREISFGSGYRYPDDPEDQARHNAKLPSDEVIQAVVELYHEIPRTEAADRLLICLCVLLLITGFRIGEALCLPWDCLQNFIRDRADGKGPLLDEEGMPVVYSKFRQYLPEKNGEKVTAQRYLGRIGSQVLRAVYEEIQDITRPFHDTATWMANRPGRALLLPLAPQKQWFTREEVDGFFGKESMGRFIRNYKLESEIHEGWSEPMFPRSELERVVLGKSKIGVVRSIPWPIHTHEILFVVGSLTFSGPFRRRTNQGIPNAVIPLRSPTFCKFLVGNKTSKSVFERYGKSDAYGKPLRITSHQFRHWLNNEMYLGGMSEVQISYQFGRYNKRSNSAYDHRDPIQRAKALQEAARKGKILGEFGTALKRMNVVDREAWIKSAYMNVHWGPLGGCADETIRRADAMPKECANCGGLIVVKGDLEGREEAARQLQFTEWWLVKAAEDVQDGDPDNDLQIQYYRHKATSLRRIIGIHDDPSIPDGTHVLMDFIAGTAIELMEGACHA